MMATPLPPELFPRDVSFHIENVSRSGGVATNGQEQVVGSAAGRWRARLTGCPVTTDEQILAFRAWLFGMQGRSGTTVVPVFGEKLRANWPVDPYGRRLSPAAVRRSRLDGTQFADPSLPDQSRIVEHVTANVARRATTLPISVTQGSAVRAGQYLSIGVNLYAITAVLSSSLVTIRPGLRMPVPAGTAINFEAPACEMRLASDDVGQLDLQLARWGFVDLDFVEAY